MAEEELERFRRQWREEVRARDRLRPGAQQGPGVGAVFASRAGEAPAPTRRVADPERAIDGAWNFDDLEEKEQARRLGESGTGKHPEARAAKEPKTALEHYERAVDCETQGRLGDSLVHYRKAFKLNDHVDQQYRNKHFPPSSFSGNARTTSEASAAQARSQPAPAPAETSELITSFADARIEGPQPEIEGAPPPKCPIAGVPTEVLREILMHCAVADVATFARLSSVCKRLAYLVAAEDSIWKQVCQHSEFGLGSMHYEFACTLKGKTLPPPELPLLEDLSLEAETDPAAKVEPQPSPADSLPLSPAYPSYKYMFHHRPRLRFGGVYISTVNYVRPGQSAPTQVTWQAPMHVVTYYRYLRFYRDGTCLSLLTTVDPPDVVPFFRLDHPEESPGIVASPGLQAVAKHTLRGRWRMSALHAPGEEGKEVEPEGNVLVETAGPKPAYTYSLQLQLRSAGKEGARNTKLVWRGFWSYNRITDDWGEFGLRNDRAFVWSRVRSWAET